MRHLQLFAALTLLAVLSISDASAASITAFLDYDISFGRRGTDLITGTVTLDTRRHTLTTDITVRGPVDPGTYSEIFEHFSANDFSRHDELALGSLSGHHNVFLEAIPSTNGFSSGETFVSFHFVDGDGRIRARAAEPAHAITVLSAAASALRAWYRCSASGALSQPGWLLYKWDVYDF